MKIEKIGDGFGLVLPKESRDVRGFESVATVAVQDKTLLIGPAAAPRAQRLGEGHTTDARARQGPSTAGRHASSGADHVECQLLRVGRRARTRAGRYPLNNGQSKGAI